jgi:hypothetical protein
MKLLAFLIRSNFVKISIVLILFQLILLYLFFDKVKTSINPKLKRPIHSVSFTKEPTIKQEQPLRNQIWEQLDENTFFKRTSAFYIIERHLLRVFLVCNPQSKNELFAKIKIELEGNQVYFIHLKDGYTKQHAAFGNYLWKSLNFNFDLLKYFQFENYENIFKSKKSFHLYVSNSNSDETLHHIDVKMKFIRRRSNKTKKNSIVCSKCFWYKSSDYKDLFWWIELHKLAGYKKVFFCNNSIPDTQEFNEIFEKNKNFIELSQLNYLPNFMDNNNDNRSSKSHNYLSSYQQLGSYYHVDSDLFNMMITNECFLNNTDKYSHVSVIDNDEVIMPRVNSKIFKTKDNFKFISNLNFDQKTLLIPDELRNLETSCSNDIENRLDNYLKSFTTKPATFHFNMGFYLRDKQIKQIIERLEAYFAKSSNLDYGKVHKISVVDLLPASTDHNVYNFTFVLNNKEEINYALNLCKIYRYLIANFEKKNSNILQKYSDRFHRFFYIGGLLSSFACGKSSHSTEVTFEFTVHYPEPDKKFPDQAELYMIGYDLGQLSHFRHVNEFHKSSQKEISVTELILDLNYLNCFYKPIVESFSKIKLF